MKKYNVVEVINELRRNVDIKIKDNVIYVKTASNPTYQGKVGNSTHGKLSFLEKNGFTIVRDNGDGKVDVEPSIPAPKEKIKIKKHVV
jgi:hypothetical protein